MDAVFRLLITFLSGVLTVDGLFCTFVCGFIPPPNVHLKPPSNTIPVLPPLLSNLPSEATVTSLFILPMFYSVVFVKF